MAKVFTQGAYVTSGPDDSRKILISVQLPDGITLFNNCFLTNFESSRSSDAAIMKNIDEGFMFTTFGSSAVTLTVTGIYSGDVVYSDSTDEDKGKEYNKDPEQIFDMLNISAKSRKVVTITTLYGDMKTKPIQYKGYMISFNKNPMTDDKFKAYGFKLTFVASVTHTDEAGNDDNK